MGSYYDAQAGPISRHYQSCLDLLSSWDYGHISQSPAPSFLMKVTTMIILPLIHYCICGGSVEIDNFSF
jgi:hypothetical protein